MNGLLTISLAAVALAVVGALALAPLRLPWPRRVRWTTTVAQHSAHMGLMIAYPPFDIREVTLVALHCGRRGLYIEVHESGRRPTDTMVLTRSADVEPCTEVLLRDWLALDTPMVLFVDRNGDAVIEGPVASITGLSVDFRDTTVSPV
jgi:hypothetical protein